LYRAQLVPEINVLIETLKWLYRDGWSVETISIARGAIPDYVTARKMIAEDIKFLGMSLSNVEFKHDGEDIIARKGTSLWKLECKGLSGGKTQTDRNNFDRAVASAVSYYTKTQDLRIGLSLPEYYKRYFPHRLPKTLRTRLNLWVFLYSGKDEMYAFAPDEDIPI